MILALWFFLSVERHYYVKCLEIMYIGIWLYTYKIELQNMAQGTKARWFASTLATTTSFAIDVQTPKHHSLYHLYEANHFIILWQMKNTT